LLNAMKRSKWHIELADFATIDVTITESRPRFSGGYSDVYIGRFGDKIVRLHDAPLRSTRLILSSRWL
jgi:hypothetical protein